MPLARMTRTLSHAVILITIGAAAAAAQGGDIERGRYLVAIMDCTGCHTRGVLTGRPNPDLFLAGSEAGFHLPGLDVFHPPNLTPDPATGLGDWSEDDIVRAIRTGERPDGRRCRHGSCRTTPTPP